MADEDLGSLFNNEEYLVLKKIVRKAIINSRLKYKPIGLIGMYLFIFSVLLLTDDAKVPADFLIRVLKNTVEDDLVEEKKEYVN